MTTLTASTIAQGARVEIEYRCRDIGYGVEEGDGVYTYRGRETLAGKLTLEPIDGGDTIYLFEDEIVSVEYVETIELPAAMVAVRQAASHRAGQRRIRVEVYENDVQVARRDVTYYPGQDYTVKIDTPDGTDAEVRLTTFREEV